MAQQKAAPLSTLARIRQNEAQEDSRTTYATRLALARMELLRRCWKQAIERDAMEGGNANRHWFLQWNSAPV